jgi:hypothetical protein
MKNIKSIFTIEHLVDGAMIVFALTSVGNIAEYMNSSGHNPITSYGAACALGLGLVAISILLARVSPSDKGTFWFMLSATVAVAVLSGAVQSKAYLKHGPADPLAAYLFGFGFPVIGECLLALAMSVYTEGQKRKRLNASDDAMNERINQFLNESLDNVDLSKMATHIERQVFAIVRNKIDTIAKQRLTQHKVGSTSYEVVRNDDEVGRSLPDFGGKMDDITTKEEGMLGEANEAKIRKVGERRAAIVRLVEMLGPMGAPELVQRLAEDFGIKVSAQTVRDDCAHLTDALEFVTVGRKWDVVRIVADQRPAPVGFSTNGNH